MNPTTLFDEMHGSTASIEITSHQRYKKLLHLVDDARRALLINANLRQPYVELLHSLYKTDSGACHKINRIRPTKPEDKDILQHIENHFPAVVLAEPPPSNESFTWGFTWVGIDSVNDKKIYLNGDLVNFWLRKTVRCFPTSYFLYNDPSAQKKKRISSSKLNLIITSTIFHQLAHYLMLWWSQGQCCTPVMEQVLKESGNFVELRIFGGPVMGWWEKNIGDCDGLKEIGVMTDSVPKFFRMCFFGSSIHFMHDLS